MKISVVNFDDSFNYNIASYFLEKYPTQVIESSQISRIASSSNKRRVVIWGAGPGHINEYQFCINKLRETLECPNTFTMGVCLGHQLIWSQHFPLKRIDNPIHGLAQSLSIPSWPLFEKGFWHQRCQVQIYNSLSIDAYHPHLHRENHMVMMGLLVRGITYQFHPESIATTNQDIFFSPALDFLVGKML